MALLWHVQSPCAAQHHWSPVPSPLRLSVLLACKIQGGDHPTFRQFILRPGQSLCIQFAAEFSVAHIGESSRGEDAVVAVSNLLGWMSAGLRALTISGVRNNALT